jgi:8-amino-7-oxononanoate synthase
MRQSRVPLSRRLKILHNSIRDFDHQLTRLINSDSSIVDGSKSVWIGLESLYSMDGDLALLKEFVELVERYLPRGNGHFIVDEAHSTGLYGSKGRGLVHSLGLNHKITVRVHTFGKSLACSGAVVLCQNSLIRQYLINYSRPLIYSTVLPHMNVKAIEKSIEMLEQGFQNEPCFKIHSLANLLITRLQTDLLSSSSSSCDISLPPHLRNYSSSSVTSTTTSTTTTSSIVPILTNQPRQLSNFLINRKGYLVRPITYPTVPKGSERVRICLHANNTRDQVLGLVEAIREWQQEQEQEPEQEQEKNKDKDQKKRINATTPFRARL